MAPGLLFFFFFFFFGGGGGGSSGFPVRPRSLGGHGTLTRRKGLHKGRGFIREDFSSRSKPLPFYLPFLTGKITFSYSCH